MSLKFEKFPYSKFHLNSEFITFACKGFKFGKELFPLIQSFDFFLFGTRFNFSLANFEIKDELLFLAQDLAVNIDLSYILFDFEPPHLKLVSNKYLFPAYFELDNGEHYCHLSLIFSFLFLTNPFHEPHFINFNSSISLLPRNPTLLNATCREEKWGFKPSSRVAPTPGKSIDEDKAKNVEIENSEYHTISENENFTYVNETFHASPVVELKSGELIEKLLEDQSLNLKDVNEIYFPFEIDSLFEFPEKEVFYTLFTKNWIFADAFFKEIETTVNSQVAKLGKCYILNESDFLSICPNPYFEIKSSYRYILFEKTIKLELYGIPFPAMVDRTLVRRKGDFESLDFYLDKKLARTYFFLIAAATNDVYSAIDISYNF